VLPAPRRESRSAPRTGFRSRKPGDSDQWLLHHRVGANGFFTALLREARACAGCRLATWRSALWCAAEWGDLARPDGYGIWIEPGARVPFLLEYDRGTESGSRLAEKLDGYRDLLSVAASPTWLLFRFPSASALSREHCIHGSTHEQL